MRPVYHVQALVQASLVEQASTSSLHSHMLPYVLGVFKCDLAALKAARPTVVLTQLQSAGGKLS